MKKFLSLVLALVMTMSLVTISAGATDYKDLTDKSEIDYEEAVAVMNKIGIISGYEDGSFKPDGALTRGAGAKIIAYLMLGPTAAEQLGVVTAPYKDVAADNNFAPYIAYMKSTGLINGYEDGTFRPSGALNGYAFSKMLLTALGYKSEYENFTGSGWQTNVARLAVKEGLIRGNDDYVGSATVTRQEACLYAFNLLKATMVEYKGDTITVEGTDSKVTVGNKDASYVTNSLEARESFDGKKDSLTQFCEEKYPNLKLTNNGTATDDYGRPANVWAYKNVKIGTFPVSANYVFTAKVGSNSDTDTSLENKLDLKGYKLAGNNIVTVNGKSGQSINSIANIARNYTANGTTVEIYLNNDANNPTANQIDSIVVINTQIMKVDSVSSKTIVLKQADDSLVNPASTDDLYYGSSNVVKVNSVREEDSAYNALKDMKADDYVVVTPLWNGSDYDVDAVYVPTTASGNITKVSLTGSGKPDGLTVGGTAYDLAYNWTAEDGRANLNRTSVSNTVESTLYLDAFGYVIYAGKVQASSDYIVFGDWYSSVVDGKLTHMAQGYDMNGNALSLNMGTKDSVKNSVTPGQVYEYETSTKNNAEYQWVSSAADHIETYNQKDTLSASNYSFTVGGTTYTYASGIKFIFVTKDDDGDVTGVVVKDGAQKLEVTKAAGEDLSLVTNDKRTQVKYVVVSSDDYVDFGTEVLYVSKESGSTLQGDSGNKSVSEFTAYIKGEKMEGLLASKRIDAGKFYTYTVNETTGVYTLKEYTQTAKTTSVVRDAIITSGSIINNTYINSGNVKFANGNTAVAVNLNMKNAKVIDLSDTNMDITSPKMMADAKATFSVDMVYNNSGSSDNRGQVAYIFITDIDGVGQGGGTGTGDIKDGVKISNVTVNSIGTVRANITLDRPAWVASDATVSVDYTISANGVVTKVVTNLAFAPGDTMKAISDSGYAPDDNVEIKITKVSADKVNVRYVNGDNNTDITNTRMVALGTTTTSTLATSGSNDLKFQVSTTSTGDTGLTYSVEGLHSGNKTKDDFGVNDNAQVTAGSGVYAEGNGYVTVTIYGLNIIPEKVSLNTENADLKGSGVVVTTYGAPTGTTGKLVLSASPDAITTPQTSGTTVTLSAAVDDLDGNYAYKVEVTVGNKTLSKELTTTSATVLGSFELDKNTVIKDSDVRVTAIPVLAVTGATWNLNSLTITFNGNVKDDTNANDKTLNASNTYVTEAGGGSLNANTINDISVVGNQITIVFNANLEIGNNVKISASKISSDEINANQCAATTLTIAADGKVTVA